MSDDNGIYTNAQLIILEAASTITGFISLCCSLLIIYSQFQNRKEIFKHMYERIILGACIVDVILSSGFAFLSVWVVPREVNFVIGARGSFTTCSLAGFIAQFSVGALLYFASLSVFFVLVIVVEIQERVISKWFEPLIHLIGFGVPLITGIYALSINAMNPVEGLPGSCWINEYPPDCMTQKEIDALDAVDEDSTPPELCIRGEGFKMLALVSGSFLMGITLLVVVVSMFCIVTKVYRTERRLRAYAVISESQRRRCLDMGGSDLRRTKEACFKALLYIGSFTLTYSCLISYQVVSNQDLDESKTGGLHFSFGLFTKILGPLHGFWQCLIYFRYASAESREEVATLRSSFTGAMRRSARSLFPILVPPDEHVDPPLRIETNRLGNRSISILSSAAENVSLENDEDDTGTSGIDRESTGTIDVEEGEKLDKVDHTDVEVSV